MHKMPLKINFVDCRPVVSANITSATFKVGEEFIANLTVSVDPNCTSAFEGETRVYNYTATTDLNTTPFTIINGLSNHTLYCGPSATTRAHVRSYSFGIVAIDTGGNLVSQSPLMFNLVIENCSNPLTIMA